NYTAPEFSIQLIADEFDTSISYLSQYFKEHMKITILEYSTLLRIEKAKEIMEFTHCNIQEVSDQIGYNNVSSFSRRFKQVTGQTPGEFKKALKLE
ncbi:MAG: AraC family transcriptional regulator, partial [Niameybacter sp.]